MNTRVQMEMKFLSKYECLLEAEKLIIDYKLNMSIEILAQEIYAHAKLFNIACKWYLIPFSLREYIKDKCDPIDIKSDGDTKFRQFCYKIIWKIL